MPEFDYMNNIIIIYIVGFSIFAFASLIYGNTDNDNILLVACILWPVVLSAIVFFITYAYLCTLGGKHGRTGKN